MHDGPKLGYGKRGRFLWRVALVSLLGGAFLVISPHRAEASPSFTLPKPARHDLCARYATSTVAGDINYDHGKYHWTCSGQQVAMAKFPLTLNLSCTHLDPRKRFGFWVSSHALVVQQVFWDVKAQHLALVVDNPTNHDLKASLWLSCKGPGV